MMSKNDNATVGYVNAVMNQAAKKLSEQLQSKIPPPAPVEPKRRMQFSQKICIFSCVFIVAIWLGNFVLAWYDKPQIPEAISVGFTIFGGFVTGGYFTISAVRDCSKNKHAKELRESDNGGGNNE